MKKNNESISMENITVCNVLTNYINNTFNNMKEIKVIECIQRFDNSFVLKIEPAKKEKKKNAN